MGDRSCDGASTKLRTLGEPDDPAHDHQHKRAGADAQHGLVSEDGIKLREIRKSPVPVQKCVWHLFSSTFSAAPFQAPIQARYTAGKR